MTAEFLCGIVLRSAVVMLAMMAVVRGLIWLLDLRSPVIHRWASVLVLAQGWVVAPLVIAVPWYDPEPVATKTSLHREAPPDTVLVPEISETALANPSSNSPARETTSGRSRFRRLQEVSLAQVFETLVSLSGFIWIVGICALFLGTVANYVRYCRAASSTRDPDDRAATHWRSLLSRTNCRTNLPLRWTAKTGPMLCLLPRGYEVWVPESYWLACSAAEQEAILRHELSHYRRGDIWKTWLVYLLALPQWFNPAAWWAVRNFQQAGEWLCDLDVARSSPQTAYLQAILRLVELQTPSITVAGQCAHAHPLLVRVRRLLSPSLSQDTSMKKLLFVAAAVVAAAVPLVRIELIARAADPPASLLAVKDRMTELDGKLEKVKEDLAELKTRGETVKSNIESKVSDLNKLAEDPANLSAELKEKAKSFMDGDEKTQLEMVKSLDKLASEDEQVLALGRAIKDSPHEAVRQQALAMVVAKGEAGYPAIAICFESLPGKERAYLAKELHKKSTSNDKVLLFGLMAKTADEELLGALLDIDLTAGQRLMFLASQADAKKDDEKFAAKVLEIADKGAGDEGLLLLYAIAKSSSAKNAASAVKLALKRKQDAWPVIAAAYKKEDKDCRTTVVKAAKELGGEPGDFVIKHALEDGNAELKVAAEEAVK